MIGATRTDGLTEGAAGSGRRSNDIGMARLRPSALRPLPLVAACGYKAPP